MSQLTTVENHSIVDGLSIDINVLDNPYNIPLNHLFEMAARINKKRSFLFVSKVLGKHLATPPSIPMLTGRLLAMRYMEKIQGVSQPSIQETVNLMLSDHPSLSLTEINKMIGQITLDKPVTIIGFAETATALGHAVFSSFANNARYVHTTREQVCEYKPLISFEEEHSHATSHRVYATEPAFFEDDSDIILVDDEITTGNTAINTIRSLKEHYPHKVVFTVVSILDWRSVKHREQYQSLEKELSITIHTVSLLDGEINVFGSPLLTEEKEPLPSGDNEASIPPTEYIKLGELFKSSSFISATSRNEKGKSNPSKYLQHTGRFGITSEEERENLEELKEVANHLKNSRKGKKTLVVGTGEFMFTPMILASMMGDNVYFQSTTRSPIHPSTQEDYPIQHKLSFSSPENAGITNYLYNINSEEFDEIIIFVERIAKLEDSQSLMEALKQTGIQDISIVQLTN